MDFLKGRVLLNVKLKVRNYISTNGYLIVPYVPEVQVVPEGSLVVSNLCFLVFFHRIEQEKQEFSLSHSKNLFKWVRNTLLDLLY